MDYRRCLEIQKPYLGTVKGYYTDWTPLDGRPGLFPRISTRTTLAVPQHSGAVRPAARRETRSVRAPGT